MQIFSNREALSKFKKLTQYICCGRPTIRNSDESYWDRIHFAQRDCQVKSQEASDAIQELILSGKPGMVSRFGSVELQLMLSLRKNPSSKWDDLKKLLWYLFRKESYQYWLSPSFLSQIKIQAGFFPVDEENIIRFNELNEKIAGEIDIIGSWCLGEDEFLKSSSLKIPFHDLEPFFHDQPWTKALSGKRVLVIHPFKESILTQYKKRRTLFGNSMILPDFNLEVIKAHQAIAEGATGFSTWFEALEDMKKQMREKTFDVLIVGAGAFGMPLAAYAKELGKVGFHLGGTTQLLFGIKGGRWDNEPKYKSLYNEDWVRPSGNEVVKNHKLVEGGCYW